jgi:hypothetical protein
MHRGIGIFRNRDGSLSANAPFDLSRQHLRRTIQGFKTAHIENNRVRRIRFYVKRKRARIPQPTADFPVREDRRTETPSTQLHQRTAENSVICNR